MKKVAVARNVFYETVMLESRELGSFIIFQVGFKILDLNLGLISI